MVIYDFRRELPKQREGCEEEETLRQGIFDRGYQKYEFFDI
jgi:hypothetical protein